MITEINYLVDRLGKGMDETDEILSEPEDRIMEVTQYEQQ
jgi:hypothetical protein